MWPPAAGDLALPPPLLPVPISVLRERATTGSLPETPTPAPRILGATWVSSRPLVVSDKPGASLWASVSCFVKWSWEETALPRIRFDRPLWFPPWPVMCQCTPRDGRAAATGSRAEPRGTGVLGLPLSACSLDLWPRAPWALLRGLHDPLIRPRHLDQPSPPSPVQAAVWRRVSHPWPS